MNTVDLDDCYPIYQMKDSIIISYNFDWGLIKEIIAQALSLLKPRLQKIIISYYGLSNEQPLTLKEISKECGVTPERIRQLKAQAERKLLIILAKKL
jgi:RNA polymerase sigma factor (sigma-70 family)